MATTTAATIHAVYWKLASDGIDRSASASTTAAATAAGCQTPGACRTMPTRQTTKAATTASRAMRARDFIGAAPAAGPRVLHPAADSKGSVRAVARAK